MHNSRGGLYWVLGVVAAVFAFAVWGVVDLPWRARIFPQTVAVIGLIVTALALLAASRGAQPEDATEPFAGDAPAPKERTLPSWPYLVWAGGYLVGVAAVGLPVASAVWVAVFLRREDGMDWHFAAAAGAVAAGVLVALGTIARMPSGWLFG
jgi:hypothetical protein